MKILFQLLYVFKVVLQQTTRTLVVLRIEIFNLTLITPLLRLKPPLPFFIVQSVLVDLLFQSLAQIRIRALETPNLFICFCQLVIQAIHLFRKYPLLGLHLVPRLLVHVLFALHLALNRRHYQLMRSAQFAYLCLVLLLQYLCFTLMLCHQLLFFLLTFQPHLS